MVGRSSERAAGRRRPLALLSPSAELMSPRKKNEFNSRSLIGPGRRLSDAMTGNGRRWHRCDFDDELVRRASAGDRAASNVDASCKGGGTREGGWGRGR